MSFGPFSFMSANDLLVNVGVLLVTTATPTALVLSLRLRRAHREEARLRAELGNAREELAGLYGTLTATREALAHGRSGPTATSDAVAVADALRAELAVMRDDVRRLASEPRGPLRAASRPEIPTPH